MFINTKLENTSARKFKVKWANVVLEPYETRVLEGAYPTQCRSKQDVARMQADIDKGLSVSIVSDLPVASEAPPIRKRKIEAPKIQYVEPKTDLTTKGDWTKDGVKEGAIEDFRKEAESIDDEGEVTETSKEAVDIFTGDVDKPRLFKYSYEEKKTPKISESAKRTADLLKEGKTIKQISEERQLTSETIDRHKTQAVDAGIIKE